MRTKKIIQNERKGEKQTVALKRKRQKERRSRKKEKYSDGPIKLIIFHGRESSFSDQFQSS
jgi:hypothetical protein